MNWNKTQLVSIHRPGRVISIYKDRKDDWCILLQVSSYLLHRYIHRPGRPVVEVGQMVWDRDGLVCEEEHNG